MDEVASRASAAAERHDLHGLFAAVRRLGPYVPRGLSRAPAGAARGDTRSDATAAAEQHFAELTCAQDAPPRLSVPGWPGSLAGSITPAAYRRALMAIGSRKACGQDNIPPVVAQQFADEARALLTPLLLDVAVHGRQPASWKRALMVMVPKPGGISAGARGVAICPVFGRRSTGLCGKRSPGHS